MALSRDFLTFQINGSEVRVPGDQGLTMLSEFLRREAGLTGTKVVCAEGDCGACTVLMRTEGAGSSSFVPMNSCIAPLLQIDGSSIVTVDALGKPDALTPVQKAVVDCHGSQCGYCTPGFIMALTGLVEKKQCDRKASPSLSEAEVKNALTGNLCRCTGYQPLIDAGIAINPTRCASVSEQYTTAAVTKKIKAASQIPFSIDGEGISVTAPRSLKTAQAFLKKNRDAILWASGTDLGVAANKGKPLPQKVLSLHLIPELREIKALKNGRIRVGATATLEEVRRFIKRRIPEFAQLLDVFASPQIKNVGTLVGNVANASPIADTPPFLLVTKATIHTLGPAGKRVISIDDFYLGYRKTSLKRGEMITAIEFDTPDRSEKLRLLKVARRKDLDISTLQAAFRVRLSKKAPYVVETARIAWAGMAATPVRTLKLERLLIKKPLNEKTIQDAVAVLGQELKPISDLRASASYRTTVAENLLKRFLTEAGSR